MTHHSQSDHSHSHHSHSHPAGATQHRGLAMLAPGIFGRAAVHRLDRRRFIADLGRGTFALAIVGTVGACSSSPPETATADPTAAESTTEPDPTAVPDPTAAPAAEQTDVAETAETTDSPADQGLQWSQVSLGFVSAYVLVRGNTAAIVDSGTAGSTEAIGNALATFGANYNDVAHVLLTHAHGDHVGGLPGILDAAPNAMAYAGAADAPNIESSVPLTAVGDGDDVFGLEIFETPGHTAGSISMLDPGIGLLIAGDALNTNDTGSEITAANPGFSADMGAADQSVIKLAALDVNSLVVGHGNPVESGAGELLTTLAASLG